MLNKLWSKYCPIFRLLLICLVITAFFQSCETTKITTQRKAKPMFFKKIYNNIGENYLNYENLYLKFDASILDSNKTRSFSGTIKIKKDSIIWVSISPALGIEIARVVMTNDSVKMMNKIDKTYFLGDYDYLTEIFDVDLDYRILQAILTNELFTYPNSEDIDDPKHSFDTDIDSIYYMLRTFKKRELKKNIKNRRGRDEDFIAQKILVIAEFFKIKDVSIHEFASNRELNITYDDYIIYEETTFPEKLGIHASTEKGEFKLDLKFTKIMENDNSKFPFRIPEKYEPMK